MALSPIAFIAPNYRDFKTYWLKAYEPGTTTPKTMALDSGGVVTVAKLELNADGFLESAGGALVIPYLNGAYDLWLFPTEAEADANDTVSAERVADNILGVLPDDAIETLLINDISQAYDFATVAEYKSFATSFPIGKVVGLLDRGAEFTVISGTGTANNMDIINSDVFSQSLTLTLKGINSATAFGAALDWNGTAGTNDTAVLQRIHAIGVNYSLDGKFALINDSLEFHDNQSIYPYGGGMHKAEAGYMFTANASSKANITIHGGFFTGNLLASFADCTGTPGSGGFNTSARTISFLGCQTIGVDVAFNWDNARRCHIERGSYDCRTAVIYTNKSAECTIDSVVFAKDEDIATIGSRGIKSFAGVDGFPEGLSVSKTLFFRFEHNLDIDDLFIAGFTDCYFDSGGVDVKQSLLKYGAKTEGLKFNGCWFFGRGVVWGDSFYSSPKLYRSSMIGCHFNFMEPGTDVVFDQFVHAITFSGCQHDSAQAGTTIGYVGVAQNNGIIIDSPSFQGYSSYVQFKVVGEHNSISNIPNRDNISIPIFLEYPVNVTGVEGYSVQDDVVIVGGSFIAGAQIAFVDDVLLSGGIAWVNFELSGFNAPSSGFLQVAVFEPGGLVNNADITLLSNIALISYTSSDTAIRCTLPMKVDKATTVKVVLFNEAGSSPTISGGNFADSLTVIQ